MLFIQLNSSILKCRNRLPRTCIKKKEKGWHVHERDWLEIYGKNQPNQKLGWAFEGPEVAQ